jgi:uncharacterized membrane protein YgcG
MKLHGIIELTVAGERVLRAPGFWDKVKAAFGGEPDLRTDTVRASLEATAIVEAVRGALSRLGATNAISLVIDDQVLFQDREGRPDDFGDLFLAFHDNAPVFGGSFRLLRLAAEHDEAGLHLVIETIARSEHPVEDPAARVVVAGRVRDFEPRQGEDGESYRQRVEPLARDAPRLEATKRQFESFIARLGDSLRAAMPEAEVRVLEAKALVEKPSQRPAKPAPPTSRRYDPYAYHYGSPLDSLVSVVMWSALLSMGHHHPDVVVVDQDQDQDSTADGGHPSEDGDGGEFEGGGDDGGGGDFDGGDFGGDF